MKNIFKIKPILMLMDLVRFFHVKQSDFRNIKWFSKKKTVTRRNAITSKLIKKFDSKFDTIFLKPIYKLL